MTKKKSGATTTEILTQDMKDIRVIEDGLLTSLALVEGKIAEASLDGIVDVRMIKTQCTIANSLTNVKKELKATEVIAELDRKVEMLLEERGH